MAIKVQSAIVIQIFEELLHHYDKNRDLGL